MPEFRSRPLSRDSLLAELTAFCSECSARGHTQATLSFGWDSELEFHEMWKPYELPISDARMKVEEAEAQGIVRLGASDVFISVSGVELMLCHESDLHLKGDGPLFLAIAARWQQAGLEPSEVRPSSFKWPGSG
jgi:hypothetical protein